MAALIIIVVVLAAGTAAVIIFSQPKTEKISTPVVDKGKNSEPSPAVGMKVFHDPSGFTFSYPENLLASSAANIKDQSVYSELTLSSTEKKGGIEIQALSSNLKKVDAWLTENKIPLTDQRVVKLKLADLEARQLNEKTSITTVAVDSGVIFLISTDLQDDTDYWKNVTNDVVSTFKFVQPASASNTSGDNSSSDDVVLEGEEVVE